MSELSARDGRESAAFVSEEGSRGRSERWQRGGSWTALAWLSCTRSPLVRVGERTGSKAPSSSSPKPHLPPSPSAASPFNPANPFPSSLRESHLTMTRLKDAHRRIMLAYAPFSALHPRSRLAAKLILVLACFVETIPIEEDHLTLLQKSTKQRYTLFIRFVPPL